MSVDMYMLVDGASGESKDANHKGWTDILSYSWGANQPGSMSTGGGGGIGKVSFDDLTVQAYADKATPAILKYCANGKHLPQIQLSICKAGGSQVEYKRVTLTDVLVVAVQQNADQNSEAVKITYRFQAAKVKQQYWEQTDQGGKGSESVLSWNIKENREM
ncbi:Hcp family type VI secretion system effector [Paraburkholderia silviterrae]|uniref:Type VI secretion system tube protein Hcp n=1 Tax=Paraburkholderia silviterrae TaxID=2528715 RepID=A0A4R5MAU0_9BURK|nr:type VI secretion system tube protein Hcp [Paraburkholderia silviterrae]TDG23801.1 type VI secretion system tube protein Hcp [Paraburkholderia silviterrae]